MIREILENLNEKNQGDYKKGFTQKDAKAYVKELEKELDKVKTQGEENNINDLISIVKSDWGL